MPNKHYYTIMESPLGQLTLTSCGNKLTGLHLPALASGLNLKNHICDPHVFKDTRSQLLEYFEGKRRIFDLPLAPTGTPFQQKVWKELQTIEYGKSLTYSEVAEMINHKGAFRAVGNANGRNPICIIIPCHRVLASNGKLGGYSGGLEVKKWLLHHEGHGKSTLQ